MLDLYTDQKSVTEGEIVDIHWVSDSVEGLKLTLDNGFRSTTIDLSEPSGSKKFRLNRSKGRTRFTLSALEKGRKKSDSIRIRVKPMPTTKSETIYEERPHRNPFRRASQPKGRIGEWWNNQRNRFSYSWRLLTPKKQMAATCLGIIGLGAMLGLIAPALTTLSYCGLMVYLTVVLLRKN